MMWLDVAWVEVVALTQDRIRLPIFFPLRLFSRGTFPPQKKMGENGHY